MAADGAGAPDRSKSPNLPRCANASPPTSSTRAAVAVTRPVVRRSPKPDVASREEQHAAEKVDRAVDQVRREPLARLRVVDNRARAEGRTPPQRRRQIGPRDSLIVA